MNTENLDKLQSAVIETINKKETSSNNKYHFDNLRLFFGEDYVVHGITIMQPTIGDVIEVGEKKFYSAISPFVSNSTSIRLALWNLGEKNWCKIKDIQVFSLLIQNPDTDFTPLKLFFKDFDFTGFRLVGYKDENFADQLGLYDKTSDILLTEDEYMEIAEYIRTVVDIHPKVEKAKGKTAREWMIQEEQMNFANRTETENSNLLPVISALTNHPGFKYKLEELKQVKMYQFYDAIQRLQIYEQTHALMSGSYSGFCDTSKLNKELFNFMREIKE